LVITNFRLYDQGHEQEENAPAKEALHTKIADSLVPPHLLLKEIATIVLTELDWS
jgi:hypothetical protein